MENIQSFDNFNEKKVTKKKTNSELSKPKKKDKNKSKKLTLNRTFKSMNEDKGESQNYMFFSNLQTIKRLVDDMLKMDEKEVDEMLTNGHNWALDHMATSKDDVEEVYNFLRSESTNEEINFKSLAAGALMALAVSCNRGEVNGVKTETYVGDLKVKKIELAGSKINWFMIYGKDKDGKDVVFHTDQLTFNVGDSVHVDFKKQEAYPLDDKDNISNVENFK